VADVAPMAGIAHLVLRIDDPSNLLAPDAAADTLECVNFRFVSSPLCGESGRERRNDPPGRGVGVPAIP